MRHRVRARLPEWRRRGAPEQVQRWIRSGAPIEWISRQRPPKFDMGVSCARGSLTAAQQTFLDAEIRRCCDVVGSWERAMCRDWVSKAFLVPKPGYTDRWRIVVDLRPLNKFCKKHKLRSETLGGLSQLAQPGDFMVSFDLQDGYNAVGVDPADVVI